LCMLQVLKQSCQAVTHLNVITYYLYGYTV
jgi:hypothetical protein